MARIQNKHIEYDPSKDYFDEVFLLSFENESLTGQVEQLTDEVQSLWKQIQRYERKLYGKKDRRKDSELKKFFVCHVCSKKYAYKTSLTMHIKLKHTNSLKFYKKY